MQQLDSWTNSVIVQTDMLPLVSPEPDFGDRRETITAQSIRAISRIKLSRYALYFPIYLRSHPLTPLQCTNQNPSLPGLLRHTHLHQKTLRPNSRKPKQHTNRTTNKTRHPSTRDKQRLLLLQQPRPLPTRLLNRIHDPLRLFNLIRHPPLHPAIPTIPLRIRIPLQPATLCKDLSTIRTHHLPHVRGFALSTAVM